MFLQDFSALLHTIYYMFLLPPRPLVVKPSVLQLQQFGIPSHSVSGNHHLFAPSNIISKLIYLPSPASPFPTQRHQRLRLEHAWIRALYKFCDNNNNNNNKTTVAETSPLLDIDSCQHLWDHIRTRRPCSGDKCILFQTFTKKYLFARYYCI